MSESQFWTFVGLVLVAFFIFILTADDDNYPKGGT